MGPTVVAVMAVELVLALVVVVARLYTRLFVKRNFGWDDTMIILAWVFVATYTGIMFAIVSMGYGKHQTSLGLATYSEIVRIELVAQTFAVLSYIPGKISIAIFLLRIFPSRKFHAIMWFVIVVNSATFLLNAIFDYAQCNPPKALWDAQARLTAKCWDPKVYAHYSVYTGAIGAFFDLLLALCPWYYIIQLQSKKLGEKIAIACSMSCGVFACVCAILKTIANNSLSSRTDYAYDTIPLVLWSATELCMITIAACVPTLGPLYWNYRKNTQPQQSSDGQFKLHSLKNGFTSRSHIQDKHRKLPDNISEEAMINDGSFQRDDHPLEQILGTARIG